MNQFKKAAQALVWLGPASRLKNWMLRGLGHHIHPTAIARSCLVINVSHFSMAAGSRIGRWNAIKNLLELSLETEATIGRFNTITANGVFARLYRDGARLTLAEHSYVTSRHRLDCSGSVHVGAFASVAGHSTTILTHSIDLRRDAQAAYPVIIGERSFLGTNCTLLGGAEMPPHSVLGAGSVLTRTRGQREPGLWAGVPATHRGPTAGLWFTRSVTGTRRVYIPATGETVENAF